MEHRDDFARFLSEADGDLTDGQREHLRGLGINGRGDK